MVKVLSELPGIGPRGPRGFDWTEIAAAVEAAKGAWCEIGVFHPSTVSHVRNGRYPAVDPERFEITSRTAGARNKSTLYMRLRT